MAKRFISLLIILTFCIGLCACDKEDRSNTKQSKSSPGYDDMLAAQAQEEALEVLDAYWNEEIGNTDAADSLEQVLAKWKRNTDVLALYEYLEDLEEWLYSRNSTDSLRELEDNISMLAFYKEQGKDQKLAAQMQEDMLELIDQVLSLEISTGDAYITTQDLNDEWKERTKLLFFYDLIDVFEFSMRHGGLSVSDIKYYKDSIESYDFD